MFRARFVTLPRSPLPEEPTLRLRSLCFATAALAIAALSGAPGRACAEPHVMPDSTVLDIWQLSNGLRVVVRHVPRATYVAMTMAWPVGSDSDPAGQFGRADLLAELWMTSEAGDTPERTRDELDNLRPSGWDASASSRVTRFTEVVTRAQFPGALRQLARRLQGVTLSDSGVQRAIDELRKDGRARRAPTGNAELYAATRQLGRGGYDPEGLETGLRALGKLRRDELQALVSRTYVPAGAVLSLAGNVGEMNLRALVQNEFSTIAAGTRPPETATPSLKSGSLDLKRAGLRQPVGALAVIAPALDDSLHPSFFLNMLFLGSVAQRDWKAAPVPLTSRFQYSLFDEPELARFYPPIDPGMAADSSADFEFNELVSGVGAMVFSSEAFEGMLGGVGWLLGSPLPVELQVRARRDAGVLATLAGNQAVRELWGGEPFWAEYRRQLTPDPKLGFHVWVNYLLDRSHRVKMFLHPAR